MLKQRALNATLWSGADIFLRQGLQFLVAIALARLLSPNDFGTIALLAFFTSLASVFVDGGLSVALIQRQDTDHIDESTVFWCNLGIGLATALILMLAGHAIATFYHLPILVPLMAMMALNVLIGASGTIHVTLLRKGLNFRLQMLIGMASAIGSGGIAIFMAICGYGVWALAVQILAMTSITTALLWIFHRWRPAWAVSCNSIRKLFRFGGYYMAANMLDVGYVRLYTLFVGKMYGPRELGFYSNADTTSQLPYGFLAGVLGRVVLPMFSAAARDKAKLRRGLQVAVRGMMLINIPVMLSMAALAEELVQILFGDRWLAAVPILQVLCFAALLAPLHMININVLLAQGHSRLLFRLELGKKLFGITLMSIGSVFGVMGIAWSQVAYSVLALAFSARYTARLAGYGAGNQLRDSLPIFCLGLGVACVVHAIARAWEIAPQIKFVALVFVGATLFLTVAWMLRMTALVDVLALFHRQPIQYTRGAS